MNPTITYYMVTMQHTVLHTMLIFKTLVPTVLSHITLLIKQTSLSIAQANSSFKCLNTCTQIHLHNLRTVHTY